MHFSGSTLNVQRSTFNGMNGRVDGSGAVKCQARIAGCSCSKQRIRPTLQSGCESSIQLLPMLQSVFAALCSSNRTTGRALRDGAPILQRTHLPRWDDSVAAAPR